jgi:hypothetical protein
MRLSIADLALALSGLFGVPADCQFNSSIQGVVNDNSAAVIPGATIRVTNVATGVTREVTTSDEGLFRVLSLGPGSYRIIVQKQGFQSVERSAAPLGISETVRVDLTIVDDCWRARGIVTQRPQITIPRSGVQRNACMSVSFCKTEAPTTSISSFTVTATFAVFLPSVPRSRGTPFCQRTACGPMANPAKLVLSHVPVEPAASPCY